MPDCQTMPVSGSTPVDADEPASHLEDWAAAVATVRTDEGWLADHADRQREAVAWARWKLQKGDGDPKYDGTGVSVPGNEQSYRQRIGTTGRAMRPYTPADATPTERGRSYGPAYDPDR